MTQQTDPCSICLERVDTATNYCVTPCNHVFHASCLLRAALTSPHCPLCRGDLLPTPTQPPYILQQLVHAYEQDQLSNNIYQRISSRLTDIITTATLSNFGQDDLLNYLETHHIENAPTELSSTNIIAIIISAIERDEEYFHQNIANTRNNPAERHQQLINTLYSLLQYNRERILNNVAIQSRAPYQTPAWPSNNRQPVIFFHPE
jgi:hypothetical protein